MIIMYEQELRALLDELRELPNEAAVTGQKAKYIKTRRLDDNHYIELIMEYLRKYDYAGRKDINELLIDKLPDILSMEQKMHKINRLLSEIMRKKLTLIKNIGTDRAPKWVLTDKEE